MQTPEEIETTVAGIRAWLEGKPAQMRTGVLDWIDCGPHELASNAEITVRCSNLFRPKPEPKLRPWEPEELPMDALFREMGFPEKWFKISNRWMANVAGVAFLYIELSDHDKDRTSLEGLFKMNEHSTDGGKTWLPCGVMEAAT